MERNQSQRQSSGPSTSRSPVREEPNFRPPEKKAATPSGFSKFILAGLLIAFIGGGGFLASKMLQRSSGGEEISQAYENKKEFVQSILALRDEDYHPDKLPALRKAYKTKIGPSHLKEEKPLANIKNQAPAEVHDHSHESQIVVDDSEDKYNRERETTLESESMLMQLSEETIAREEKAEAEIRKLREEQRRKIEQMQAGQNQSRPESAGNLGLFKGILTKCHIHGHDVHWITEFGMIIDHVEKQDPLYGRAMEARSIINSQGRVVVVLYENGIQVYDSLGNLK